MGHDGPPDSEKRQTLRRFAAVGAVGPFAATERLRLPDPTPERRVAVLEHIRQTPGVHFSQLRDDLDLGTGETQYHLRRLESADRIVSHEDGTYRRLFIAGTFDEQQRAILSVLRRRTHGAILVAGLQAPPISPGNLAESLSISTPAVSRAAGELEEMGMIERRDGTYHVRHRKTVQVLIEAYANTLDEPIESMARNNNVLT